MAAVAVPLGLAPCPDCRGGREINGVPCRSCADDVRRPRPRRRWLPRGMLRRVAHASAAPAGAAVGLLPGLGGAAAVTAGLAVTVHAVWHVLPVTGVALVVGGVFGLLIDRRT